MRPARAARDWQASARCQPCVFSSPYYSPDRDGSAQTIALCRGAGKCRHGRHRVDARKPPTRSDFALSRYVGSTSPQGEVGLSLCAPARMGGFNKQMGRGLARPIATVDDRTALRKQFDEADAVRGVAAEEDAVRIGRIDVDTTGIL